MNIRVVIIEDEFYTRQAIRKYIERIGEPYQVCGEAGNGEDGLELLRRERPDIALVDITMPVLGGIDMIKAAREEGIATEMIILTGFSEFSFAQAALQLGVCDYLLKPLRIEELEKGLTGALKRISRQQETSRLEGLDVRSLLGGKLAEQLMFGDASSAETDMLLEYLDFPANLGLYYVALIQFCGDGVRAAAVLRETSELIREEAERRGLKALMGVLGEQTLYLLLNAPVDFDLARAEAFLSDLGRLLYDRLATQVKVAVSRGSCGLDSVRDAFLEAQAVLKLFLFGSSEDVAVHTHAPVVARPSALLTSEMKKEMLSLLQKGARKPLTDFIDECFAQAGRVSTHSNAMFLFLAEMVSVILEYRREHGVDADEAHWDHSVYPTLFAITHVEEMRQFVRDFAVETLQHVPEQGAYTGLVRGIRKYVDDNFTDAALCLQDIAQANAISVQHMCAVYRRASGGTIGDYIFNMRMDHARKMIAEGHRNVTDIAEACGYEDPGYFSKCFRRRFGMTPRRYIETRSE